MARYCFYCGRELGDHEKCDCRNRAYVAGQGRQSPPPPPGREETASSGQGPAYRESWQHREDTGPQPFTSKTRSRTSYAGDRQDRIRKAQSFLRFFASPADAMATDLSPLWSPSHTGWLTFSLLLSGLLYAQANRRLSLLLGAISKTPSLALAFLAWLTGTAFVALIFLLYTLTLWLLARFLYRQGGLPFLHTLAAGKTAWKYLTLFFALALPSVFTGAAPYGLILALMGLVFSILVHARQLASLIYLDDNKAWQLAVLSLILFAGILSSVTLVVRNLALVS